MVDFDFSLLAKLAIVGLIAIIGGPIALIVWVVWRALHA